jgi:hypothetical protein
VFGKSRKIFAIPKSQAEMPVPLVENSSTRSSNPLPTPFRVAPLNCFRETTMINAEHLIRWGYAPGRWFHQAIMEAERARREGASEAEIRELVSRLALKALEEETINPLGGGSPRPPAATDGKTL